MTLNIQWKQRVPKMYDGYVDETPVVTVWESPFADQAGVWRWRPLPLESGRVHGDFTSAEAAKRAAVAGVGEGGTV